VTTEEAAKVDEILRYAADPAGGEEFLLDFQGIELVSSDFLVALVRLRHTLSAAGRRLALCHLSGSLAEVFAVTGLSRFFDVRPDPPPGGSGETAKEP
jgi:anti-anti-sigma factor